MANKKRKLRYRLLGIVHWRRYTGTPPDAPTEFALVCINGGAYSVPVEEQIQMRLRPEDKPQTLQVAGPTTDSLPDCHQ